jgi:hypothetical protein
LALVLKVPEAMKYTAAMVALKAIEDPLAFLKLNSTSEYIDLYMDSTSIPLCYFLIQLYNNKITKPQTQLQAL